MPDEEGLRKWSSTIAEVHWNGAPKYRVHWGPLEVPKGFELHGLEWTADRGITRPQIEMISVCGMLTLFDPKAGYRGSDAMVLRFTMNFPFKSREPNAPKDYIRLGKGIPFKRCPYGEIAFHDRAAEPHNEVVDTKWDFPGRARIRIILVGKAVKSDHKPVNPL